MKEKIPFASIEKSDTVNEYRGSLQTFTSLTEMQEYIRNKVNATLVFMNPFHTITERKGDYQAHGQEPILAIDVEETSTTSREQLLAEIPDIHITLTELIKPQLSDEEYARIADEILETEIRG